MKKKYRALGLLFGAGIGLCVGLLTDNIAFGISLGAGVGLVISTALGTSVNKENEQ